MDQGVKEDSVPKKKEPYVKPDFRHERVFAVEALQCGKVNSTQEGCSTTKKVS